MSVPEAWHLPLIAVGVGFHLAVSWALLWRYFQARERSLLTWGLAWLLLAVHVLGMFLTRMGLDAMAPMLRDLSFAGAAVAFLAGQVEREGRAFRLRTPYALGVGAALAASVLLGFLLHAPVTIPTMTLVIFCFLGSAWLASPLGTGSMGSGSMGSGSIGTGSIGTGSIEVTRWLFFLGYLLGAAHTAGYFFGPARHGATWEIGGHASFSLLFSAAVTWQAWEHERAVRLFSRTLERLNHPLSTQESLDEALKAVAGTLRVTHGWILLRETGRGGAEGGWNVGAAIGFPEWARHGLHRPEYPIDTCLCIRPVDPKRLTSSVVDLACVRLTHEVGRPSGRHLTIPLGTDGEVQGVMVLLAPAGRFFAPADMEMLTAMGEQIGLALDRARLYDELKAKEAARGRLMAQLITAQEDERRRIARELHDETGQALTALVVNLDFLVRHPIDEAALRKQLAVVRDMAESTLAEVRRVIHEMRPTVLDDLGLEAAIRWLVKRYEPSGLKTAVDVKGLNQRLPGHIEISVFRLVQEACTNTIKHANAKTLQIRVLRQGSWLTVEVSDDGRGMDVSSKGQKGRSTGMGLAGLKERIALAGGSLTVESAPGAGTRLYAELPTGAEGAVDEDDSSADLRRPHHGASGSAHGAAVGARLRTGGGGGPG
ncbi:MAG TPA: GAF domain-containing sensor histidine kinase [Symbiobacteriaceae bacterium]